MMCKWILEGQARPQRQKEERAGILDGRKGMSRCPERAAQARSQGTWGKVAEDVTKKEPGPSNWPQGRRRP